MKRFVVPFQILGLLAIALACYVVSMKVGSVQKDIDDLNKNIAKREQSIDLLNTELASLGRFERIQALSDAHLGLEAPKDKQLVGSVVQLASLAPEAPDLAIKPERPTDTQLVSLVERPAPVQAAQSHPASGLQAAVARVQAPDASPAGIGPSLVALVEAAAAHEARVRP